MVHLIRMDSVISQTEPFLVTEKKQEYAAILPSAES